MATVEELRLKILDRPQATVGERVGTGDGIVDVYKLSRCPVMLDSAAVYLDGEKKTETTDYVLDYATGKLTFVSAPGDGIVITADYEVATFSDSDLEAFLDSSGSNLSLAAGLALTSLVADRSRLVTWSRGDMKIDYDRLRKDLSEVARRFYAQGASESAGAVTQSVDWEEVV